MYLFKEIVLSFLIGNGIVAPTATSPVVQMSMDKGTTQNVLEDQSGYKNHGKIVGSLSFTEDRFGNSCRALLFNGNGYVNIDHSKSLQFDERFSLSVWLKLPSQTFQWLTLVCKGQNATEQPDSPSYRVQLTSTTASINTESTPILGEQLQMYPQNQWFHLCATYDQQELSIYIDGKKTYTYPLQTQLSPNLAALEIGRDIPGSTEFFEGAMDELALFPRVLNRKEIIQLAQNNQGKQLGDGCKGSMPTAPQQLASLEAIDLSKLQAKPQKKVATKTANNYLPKKTQQTVQPNLANIDVSMLQTKKASSNNKVKTKSNLDSLLSISTRRVVPSYPFADLDLSSVDIQHKMSTSTKQVTIRVYDHLIVDNDTISFYWNNQLLIDKEPIEARSRHKFEFKVELKENQPNLFVVKAHNFGTSGPKVNTVTVEVDDYVNSVYMKKLEIKDLNLPAALDIKLQ